jgi:hypothetical protein
MTHVAVEHKHHVSKIKTHVAPFALCGFFNIFFRHSSTGLYCVCFDICSLQLALPTSLIPLTYPEVGSDGVTL